MAEVTSPSASTDDHNPPTASPAPFHTPSRTASRQSRRRDSSPGISSSPPSFPVQQFSPGEEIEHAVIDYAMDETISPLDPRRFTPTLHASLVSEILSLRRELESKNKEMDALEATIDEIRTENEHLSENLAKHTKENRSLKRQMQLLEGGTSSALSDLARERDEAVENITDIRRKLEQTQKKLKAREEENERTQNLWERDRDKWEAERRNWQRKLHVAENRLKTILNEVAAAQAVGSLNNRPATAATAATDTGDDTTTDTASPRSRVEFGRRRPSTASASTHDGEPFLINSGRFSMSYANGQGGKADGLNLADELALDEYDEDAMDTMDEFQETRPASMSSQVSYAMSMKARKILGLSMEGSIEQATVVDAESAAGDRDELDFRVDYRDVGTQYTPPPSPELRAKERDLEEVREVSTQSEPAILGPEMQDRGIGTVEIDTVSTSCQTDPELSQAVAKPPEPAPKSASESARNFSPERSSGLEGESFRSVVSVPMVSVSTQTEPLEEVRPKAQTPPPIPMIAIHPPASEPTSPSSSVVLPPNMKNASSQTDIELSRDVRSIAMQTEEIRVDKRLVKLPASLLPSAINDQPPAKEESTDIPQMPFIAPPPRSPHRKPLKPPVEIPERTTAPDKGKQPDIVQAYPGNNDNGPLAKNDSSDIRRPLRSSSLFAGFDDNPSDEERESTTGMPSEDELPSRPRPSFARRPTKKIRRSSVDEKNSLPEIDETDSEMPASLVRTRPAPTRKASRKMGSSSKQADIRRSTLISNGATAHQRARPRSPSEPFEGGSPAVTRPPFPVPVRLSSRKIPTSASDGAQSPSPTPYSGSSRYGSEQGNRRLTRQLTLRKVRSAATMQQDTASNRTRSPPALSTSSYAPDDSPQLPDDIPVPRTKRSARTMATSRTASSSIHSQSREEVLTGSVHPTSVVDAIAQTMVGEWMYKYVRRRKSFGKTDAKDSWEGKSTDEVSANITSSGVRHRRWVWLAPYERAVMWSSKQPTSGPALLGKSGRKLTIQSVLDVKDDTPLPKGAVQGKHFNRSILILTPQRALKFTALTLERHYVWLTALSFLSHSSLGLNDLASLPPVPQEEYNATRPPTATLRRNPIRDSIRVAKGKPRPQPGSKRTFGGPPVPVPEYPGEGGGMAEPVDSIGEPADPPNVPRYAGHTRKRSNTTPRVPASGPAPPPPGPQPHHNHNYNSNGFRSYSPFAPLPSPYSTTTAGSSDTYPITTAMGSRRTSEASGPSSVSTGNYFDAVGTVRMEAFVDRDDARQIAYQRRRKHEGGLWPDLDMSRSDDGSITFSDPFKGF